MKKLLILGGISFLIILAVGFYFFNKNSIPNNLEQANVFESFEQENNNLDQEIDLNEIPEIKNFSFIFTGYGPAGKSHDGTFKNFQLTTSTIVFKTESVDTGIDGLNKHLCANDFFDCQKYPEIKFTADSVIKSSENQYQVTGTLNFKEIIKKVSFTANVIDNKISTDFLLDTTEFNFDPKLVENNTRIRFSFEI
jgi:hypothetical protein